MRAAPVAGWVGARARRRARSMSTAAGTARSPRPLASLADASVAASPASYHAPVVAEFDL